MSAEQDRRCGNLLLMRSVLLFWTGFLPLLLSDLLHDRHGQVRGAAVTLLLTVALAGLFAGLTRLVWLPALRRVWAARRVEGPGTDAIWLLSGFSWASASLMLTRTSESLQSFLFRRPVLAAVSLLLLVSILLAVLPRVLPRLRAPRTPWLAIGVLMMIGGLSFWGTRLDAAGRVQRAGSESVAVDHSAIAQRPNVIVVVLDTAREDILGAEFEDQIPMPWFTEFSKSGHRWVRGYSAANSTPPGHAALFTGRYPSECGMLSKGHLALPQEQVTLAEFLTSCGYRSAAVVSNRRVGTEYGFQQGFESYDDSLVSDRLLSVIGKRLGTSALVRAAAGQIGHQAIASAFKYVMHARSDRFSAADTAKQVARTLDELDLQTDEPLFLFVNYIDQHLLYVTRPDLAEAFGPNLEDEELERVRMNSPLFHERLDLLTERIQDGETSAELGHKLRWIREAYFEQSRELDEGLQMMFEDLERRGRLGPNDVVLVTADHGEELGAHGEFLHGSAMFEASIRIPYWLRAPGIAAGVEQDVAVSNVDFIPTVLEILGLRTEHWPVPLSGVPLLRAVPEDRLVRFESGNLRGFFQGSRKMIAHDDGTALEWLHAFDLALDPFERHNLLGPGTPEWARAFALAPPFAPSRAAAEIVAGKGGGADLAALGYADEVAPEEE